MSRFMLIGLMLAAPIAGPGALLVVSAIAASLTAYEGLRSGTVYGMLATLFAVEVLYGLDVGVLSLAYMTAVLLLSLVRRVMTVAPWVSADGWHASDALRAFFVACGIFAVMASSGVMVGHFLYGYTDSVARLQSMFVPYNIAWAGIAIALVLIILRRADEPFRRRITFST